MKTTVTLDDDVADGVRHEMRRSGRGFKEAVNELLRAGLARRREAQSLQPFRVEARPLGLRPAVDYSNVGDLLEIASGPRQH